MPHRHAGIQVLFIAMVMPHGNSSVQVLVIAMIMPHRHGWCSGNSHSSGDASTFMDGVQVIVIAPVMPLPVMVVFRSWS